MIKLFRKKRGATAANKTDREWLALQARTQARMDLAKSELKKRNKK